jgi:hypothetical protein
LKQYADAPTLGWQLCYILAKKTNIARCMKTVYGHASNPAKQGCFPCPAWGRYQADISCGN